MISISSSVFKEKVLSEMSGKDFSYLKDKLSEALIEKISLTLFMIVFISIWLEEWDNIIMYISRAGVITLILNVTMMVLGFYAAKIFASGIEQRKCISLECGLQNGTLAVFVSTQIFDDIIYLIPTASYALIMFVTSIIFVFLLKKIN